VIRDNTIVVRRVRVPASWLGIRLEGKTDSTVIGVPIGLINAPASSGRAGEPGQEALIEDNLIENNRVLGAEGLGIEVLHASRNRIVNNTLTGIRRRDPFPGNVLGGRPQWQDANGSAIWVSTGSDENEIAGNTFDEVASAAVVLQGNRNRVEIRSAKDAVRDLGTGNRVSPSRTGFDML
jgi:parallel beta-helix repeat protein